MDYGDLESGIARGHVCPSHADRASMSEESHERYHIGKHLQSFEKATADSDDENDYDVPPTGRMKQSTSTAHLTQTVVAMQHELQSLREQLKAVSGNMNRTDSISNVLPLRDPLESIAREQTSDLDLHQTVMIPELREVSWSEFMTKYDDDPQEYAMDVLVGEPDYRRKSERYKATEESSAENIQQRHGDIADTADSTSITVEDIPQIPDRIRINSPQILNTLASIDKTLDASISTVMLRPFKFLVHYDDRIRHCIRRLQEKLVAHETLSPKSHAVEAGHVRKIPAIPESFNDINTVIQHMQCLVGFIDRYITPTVARLKNSTTGKIQFRDLWYVFQPGEDIFMPVKDRQRNVSLDPITATPEMFQDRYEKMWRVIGAGGGRPNLSLAHDRESQHRPNPFAINCYYIDFDGVYFCPIVHNFSIQPFSGEREITSLDFFPLRFLKQGKQLRARSKMQGELVFNALLQSHTHFYYSGPTLVTQPCGCPLDNGTLHQEYVESEVIVDYRATLFKHPSWRPKQSFWTKPPHGPGELHEKYRVEHWQDKAKSRRIRMDFDHVYNDNIIDKEKALKFKHKERMFDPIPSGWLGNQKSVPEADVALLSPRVFGFVLRTRTFAPLWLWGLQKIRAQDDGLHNLQLQDNRVKDTIHALVRTHFLKKGAHQNSDLGYDFVRGKGKGLVFLLHGAPGVGKTFTAESVAAANGRPLFQITCGDLGLTPTEVEKALKEIFRYAQLWNCVLLLDECDIFLTQRSKTDIQRNALVSIFLRTLEWWSGVLFLTTNRVGQLDSAIRSRITWSTYYPPLGLAQTKEIWKVNLNLLEQRNQNMEVDRTGILRFARDQFHSRVKQGSNWNGRQIQNAFKVAVSLAGWDTFSAEVHKQTAMDTGVLEDEAGGKLRLTAAHFQIVADAAEGFDDYLQEATGLTEAERAFNAQERADDYMKDDFVPDENGGGLLLEPVSKKRRNSSIPSVKHTQAYGGGSNPKQLSPHPARRTTNPQPQQQQQSNSRKSSYAQVGTTSLTTWSNGDLQSKSPFVSLSTAVQPSSSYDITPTTKRKRTGSGYRRSSQSLHGVRALSESNEDMSSSEFAIEAGVGSDAMDGGDDWDS